MRQNIFFFRPKFKSLGFLALTMLAASCSNDTPIPEPNPDPINKPEEKPEWHQQSPIHPDANMRSEINAMQKTGFDTFLQVWNDSRNKDKNLVVSPLSIYGAMSLLAAGADGENATELLAYLNAQSISNLNELNKTLTNNFPYLDELVTLNIANSLWNDNSIAVKEAYLNDLANYYNAEHFSRTLIGAQVTEEINTWISDHTNGKIKNLLTPTDVNPPMLLINTVFFSGSWQSHFDKEATTSDTFTLSSGKSEKVEMMHGVKDAYYIQTERAEAMRLPFGEGHYDMTFILPEKASSLEQFISSTSMDEINELVYNSRWADVDISLPKFNCTSLIPNLSENLKGMGLNSIFTPTSWNGIAEGIQMAVDKIIHCASFLIDENGGEGAAATVITTDTSTGEEPSTPKIIPFKADRPFLFVVRQSTTNTPIFIGAVMNPNRN